MDGRLRSGELQRQVLDVLAQGPMPIATVARILNRDVNTMRGAMHYMLGKRVIEFYGTARALGLDAPFGQTKCYGVPRPAGAAAAAVDDEGDDVPQPAPAARRQQGSGVVAPAPYATGFRWWNVSW